MGIDARRLFTGRHNMMRQLILRRSLVSILMASSAMAADRQPADAVTHCEPAEQIVFSCRIGPKIASLCASRRLTATEGHVQYRYGPPGKVEIAAPGLSLADRTRIKVVRSPPSTANAMAVGIERGGFSYHVYSSESVGSVSDGMRSWAYDSGVEVHKGRETVFSKRCTAQPDDAHFLASLFLDAGFEVETSAKAWGFGDRELDRPRDSKGTRR